MDSQDLELASKAHEIMLEAVEAVQKSASKLRKLQQRASHFQNSSELGSIPVSHYTMGNKKKDANQGKSVLLITGSLHLSN
jgi:hypothetical protein